MLSQVYNFTVCGWPASANSVPNEVKPFCKKHFALTTSNGCLLLGLKVVIPKKHQLSVWSFYTKGTWEWPRWSHPLDFMYGGHLSIQTLRNQFELVPIVQLWLGIQQEYHCTRGIFQENPGNVCLWTMQVLSEVKCGWLLLMHIVNGLRFMLCLLLQHKPQSNNFVKFSLTWASRTDHNR